MRSLRQITFLLLSFFLLCTSVALARPGMNSHTPEVRSMWWHNQKLTRKLEITEDQQDKFEEYLQATHAQMIDMKANVEKALFALEGAMGKNFNEQDATKKIQAYLKAQNVMMQARMNNLLNTRKVLTFEQFRELRQARKKQRNARSEGQRNGQQRPESRRH